MLRPRLLLPSSCCFSSLVPVIFSPQHYHLLQTELFLSNLRPKPKALVLLQVLAMLHALRKVCNHPACLDPEKYPQEPEASDGFGLGFLHKS